MAGRGARRSCREAARGVLEAARGRPILTLVPVVLLAARWLGGSLLALPVVCPYRLATGMPCAGCGMTRALVAMAHGRFGEALEFNPLAPLLLGSLLLWWVIAAGASWRGRSPPQVPPGLAALALLLALGLHLVRALRGSLG